MKLLCPVGLAVTALLAAACTVPATKASQKDGTMTLEWSPIAVPAEAERVRYECAVHTAEQGLPRRRVVYRAYLTETRLVSPRLPTGEYVFAVRARYRRGGQDWVTRWRAGVTGVSALVPERGLRRIKID